MTTHIDTSNTTPYPAAGQAPASAQTNTNSSTPANQPSVTVQHRQRDTAPAGTANRSPVLEKPGTGMDAENLALMLIGLRNKMSKEEANTSKEQIKNNLATKGLQHEKMIEKIEEYIDAMKEASETDNTMRILGWTAAAVTLVAAVALTVVTFGAAAPLLIAPALMIVDMSLQEAGEKNMGGQIGEAIEAMSGGEISKEDAALAGNIIWAATMVAVSIAATVATGGAAAPGLIANAILVAQVATGIAAGSLAVAQGGLAIKKGYDQKEAMDAQADQVDLKAMMKKLQSMMDNEMERLEEVISKMDEGMMNLLQMLGNVNQSKDTILANMGTSNQMV